MSNIHDLTPLAASKLSVDVIAAMENNERNMEKGATRNTPPFRGQLFGPHGRRTELVRAYGELDEVCTQLGFGTELSLGEWSMSPGWALLILARAARPPLPPPAGDWSSATISELVADIVTTHHLPLRHELERLGVLIDHLVDAHPHPNLVLLHREYHRFKDDLTLHINQEESELFPLCIELEEALLGRRAWSARDITALIRFTGHGHAENETALRRIMDQIQIVAAKFRDPDVTLVQIGVDALARDLLIHSAKEAEILIPSAIFNEELLRARHVM